MLRELLSAFSPYLSGERALEQAAQQNLLERYFTFPRFEQSARRCQAEMEKAGLAQVEMEDFPADGTTEWSGWRAMKAWDVRAARLSIVHPYHQVLSDWTLCPESLVMYSGPCDFEAELVEWDGEAGVDMRGRLPLSRRRVIDLVPQMRRLGLAGIVSDFIGTLPGVRDAFDLPDAVRWENYAFKNVAGEHWGFMITPRQGDFLRELMRQGPVRLKAEIDSRLYDGGMKSVTGVIPGTDPGSPQILLTSHLYEPGANDNASGVGLALELARSLSSAIADGRIQRPRRSIRFLLGWEGFGLMAWVHARGGQANGLFGGLNIDEIGIDPMTGKSVAHLFMPPQANYSCVGSLAEHLCGELLSPRIRWKAVTDRPEIINDAVTCDPNIDVPVATLIQYPSRFYHSSADRLGTLSAEVLDAMGNLGACFLYLLGSGTPQAMTYLTSVALASLSRALQAIEFRLIEGSWPFGVERTRRWTAIRFESLLRSLKRLGLAGPDEDWLRTGFRKTSESWWARWQPRFPKQNPPADSPAVNQARRMVLSRKTLGMTMPPEIRLPPADAEAFAATLYRSNLDLVFMKIAYWANGQRSLLDIVELLEMELDEIYQDSSIARTGTGSLIRAAPSAGIDAQAVLDVTQVVIRSGLLDCVMK